MQDDVGDSDYVVLATFRHELRRFLRFSEEAAIAAGLTPQQHQALLAIRATPQCKLLVGQLAERLMLRPHSVTGLIDRMEKLGMVTRIAASKDRRRVVVELAEQGRATLASLTVAHRTELRRLRPLLRELLDQL